MGCHGLAWVAAVLSVHIADLPLPAAYENGSDNGAPNLVTSFCVHALHAAVLTAAHHVGAAKGAQQFYVAVRELRAAVQQAVAQWPVSSLDGCHACH